MIFFKDYVMICKEGFSENSKRGLRGKMIDYRGEM